MITKSIIEKYNIPVPRYTSYPPANFFAEGFTAQNYLAAIEESNNSTPSHLSFYIHVPFCRHMCHYCGCNSFPMMKQENIDNYVTALLKEIDMVKPLLNRDRKIAQIHYGGGTPTVLPVATLKKINEKLLCDFETIENPEIAIECHPGYLDEKYWFELTQAHFNRFSLGIQDFDTTVLKGVNRKPALLPIKDIYNILRDADAKINMDFIYGLPLQTVKGFCETIEKAVELSPDRLVTFSYAHVPWVSKRQLILEKLGLPTSQNKKAMFEEASQILQAANYKTIGMDHFVKENDELYTALNSNQLHRNFQGYCTRRTTGQVYAFGVTGIGQLNSAYVQNYKTIDEYVSTIESGTLPVFKGYQLNKQEQITRFVIEMLMCNYAIHWEDACSHLNITKEELLSAINYNTETLKEFATDGLISFNEKGITMTTDGKLFVRNIAAALDPLMINTTKKFSKPV